MLKKHAQVFEALFTATDLLVVSVAWTFSYWIRFSSGLLVVDKGIPPFADYLRMLIFVWLIWAFLFRRFGLYRPMRGVRRVKEAWGVIKANFWCVVMLLAMTYLFREKSIPFSRAVFVIFLGLSTVLTVISRTLIRGFLSRMRRRGYNLRYALIVGSGSLAQSIASRFTDHPEYGIELVGCLSAGEDKGPDAASRSFRSGPEGGPMHLTSVHGNVVAAEPMSQIRARAFREPDSDVSLNVIGAYSDLGNLLEQGGIDQVILAMPLSDHQELESIIRSIGDTMVDVRIVPDVHRFIQLGSLVEEFDGLPVISLASTPLSGFNRFLKRLFDIILGTVFFALTLPVMLIAAFAVKLTSRGPVLFSQERVGLDGRRFSIYKFRTMKVDAEQSGARFAVKDDPRVTSIGGFLRKSNIDELPQLVNVILGNMSLVGPRPERPVFIQDFRRHIPRYMLRHKVQAGMTGWAQVNGWRGNTSIERRIEHDLYYIENWSLGLDLRILALTVWKSFRDGNAYQALRFSVDSS